MATTKKQQGYKTLITKTSTEVEAELVDLQVEQAANSFEQGLLSIKSQMISAESEVKKAKNTVSFAQKGFETAKSSKPELLVQNLVNARTSVKQAELDLESKQEVYNELKSLFDDLSAIKIELFS